MSCLYWTSEIDLRRMLCNFSGRLTQGSGTEKATSLLEPRKSLFVLLESIPVRASALGLFCSPHGEWLGQRTFNHIHIVSGNDEKYPVCSAWAPASAVALPRGTKLRSEDLEGWMLFFLKLCYRSK